MSSSSVSHPVPGTSDLPHPPVSQCVISFGSNLGDREQLIRVAAARVAESGLVIGGKENGLRTSRLFQTPPIGGPGGQEPFLNAIGAFETTSPAREVLDFLQHLENDLGRMRRRRWDARSIDLDVVLHGKLVGGATGLVVPHPRYTARQFVLQPACDVASHFRDPRFGWTLGQLTEHLSAAAPSLALVSGNEQLRETLCDRLAQEHSITIRATQESEIAGDACWVSPFLPSLPHSPTSPNSESGSVTASPQLPRLVVRIHQSVSGSAKSNWPAPHLMWPSGWHWPEYRLEIDDLDWAVEELASALDSMRCEVHPVTSDGDWW